MFVSFVEYAGTATKSGAFRSLCGSAAGGPMYISGSETHRCASFLLGRLYSLGTPRVERQPLWVPSKPARSPTRIVVAIVPSVDKDLLRIYSSAGFKAVERYTRDLDYFCGVGTNNDGSCSVLRAQCNPVGTEAPKIEEFATDQCPFIDVNSLK